MTVNGTGVVVVASPVGWLRIRMQQQLLTGIDFLGEEDAPASGAPDSCKRVRDAIEDYFSRPRCFPALELAPAGTGFQQRVWQALREIPVGQVVTYGQLAENLGSSARAVGNACRRNPVPLVVPCHRIVARKGLGGFSGETSGQRVAIKRWLLQHEGVEIPGC